MMIAAPSRTVALFATNQANPATGYGRMELGLAQGLRSIGYDVTPDADMGIITGDPAWGYIYGRNKRLWIFTMSEADRVSPEWVQAINDRYERCLVPAPDLVTIYQNSGVTIPVHYVPLGVDFANIQHVQRNAKAAIEATPDKPFTFLTYGLGDMRKGTDLAMMAFNRLFGGDMRFRLLIKCRDNPRWLAGLIDPQIEILRGQTSEAEWHALMARCHAFVFASRGEGFGLPPREAVLSGLPTIATKWLGLWDADQWGYPVAVADMWPAQFDYWEANAEGSRWAVPCDADIDAHMQAIADDYPAALAKAAQGRDYLLENFNWTKVAQSIDALMQHPIENPRPITVTTRPSIAIVLGSLNPGGGETQMCRLAAYLRQTDADTTIILPFGGGSLSGALTDFLNAEKVPHVSFRPLPDTLSALTATFESMKPDMVIACGYPIYIHAMLAAYKAGVPVRVTQFVSEGLERTEFPTPWYEEFMGLKAATHLTGNSQAVLRSLEQYHGAEGLPRSVIPNGVHIPDVTPAMRQKAREYWGVSDDQVVIGNLANFRHDGVKNQVMLVQAMALVVKEYPNVICFLSGYHTSYTEKVRAEINRLGLQEHVKMPGRLDDLDMLAGWDIAVNCSTTEGFSNAIQEGMAYGLPHVVTDVGGNHEIVLDGVTGYFVPSDNAPALAKALNILCNTDKGRRHVGEMARAILIKNYSWDKVAAQWLALLNSAS
jgi:glycosyltransferase involved in cell wall biosynthesis